MTGHLPLNQLSVLMILHFTVLKKPDPSDIMHITNFGKQHEEIPQDMALLFYMIIDGDASCYMTNIASPSPPLIANTSASVCISPLRLDFETYHCSNISIKDLLWTNKVKGEGFLNWHITDVNGNHITIKLPSCHIPQAEVLNSPQLLLQDVGGTSTITQDTSTFTLNSGSIIKALFCPWTSLPIFSPAGVNISCKSFLSTTFDYIQEQSMAASTPHLEKQNCFVDHASIKIFNCPQFSTIVADTITHKQTLE